MSIFLLKEKLSTWKTSLFIEITWTWSHSNPPMHVKDLLWSWRELEAIGDPVVASLLIHQRIYIFYMYKFWREQLQSPKDSYFVWKLWGLQNARWGETSMIWCPIAVSMLCWIPNGISPLLTSITKTPMVVVAKPTGNSERLQPSPPTIHSDPP